MAKNGRTAKHRGWKTFGKVVGFIVLAVFVLLAGLIVFLSVTEYKPAAVDPVTVTGESSKTLKTGETVKLLSWNLGYGALGDNADFFMDGGSMVYTASEERVRDNMEHISELIASEAPDILCVQEIDRSSARSYRINELEQLHGDLPGYSMAFANNFKVAFLPYPIPPIGKVDSGIATFSAFGLGESERQSLPCPFTWPVSMVNLKRCLLVSRIPVEGTDRELVLVNLHLEAYDDGEGKIAQTKQLAEFLETEAAKGNYVIAAGDFNQIFSTEDGTIYPQQEGKWVAGVIDVTEIDGDWQFLMDESLPTCRSLDQVYAGADKDTFQYYLIDGFIVSGNITVEAYSTLDRDFVASDHNPITLNFTLED